MKDPTYHGIENPACPACRGDIEIPEPSVPRQKLDFAQRRYTEDFTFNPEQKPNWFLTLIFHGRRDLTRVIRLSARTNGVEKYRLHHGRDPQGKPTLLLYFAAEIDAPVELRESRDWFGRILGSIPEATTSISEAVPEIRTNRFIVMGGRTPVLDGLVPPYPLVHIVQSYTKFE